MCKKTVENCQGRHKRRSCLIPMSPIGEAATLEFWTELSADGSRIKTSPAAYREGATRFLARV